MPAAEVEVSADLVRRLPALGQPIRRSDRDPGSRPYARTTPKPRKPGRKHYPHPPCRIGARFLRRVRRDQAVRNVWFC